MLRLWTLIGVSSRYDLVKSLIGQGHKSIWFPYLQLWQIGNGCVKFSKVQAEHDDLIVQWAAINYGIHLVYIVHLTHF